MSEVQVSFKEIERPIKEVSVKDERNGNTSLVAIRPEDSTYRDTPPNEYVRIMIRRALDGTGMWVTLTPKTLREFVVWAERLADQIGDSDAG